MRLPKRRQSQNALILVIIVALLGGCLKKAPHYIGINFTQEEGRWVIVEGGIQDERLIFLVIQVGKYGDPKAFQCVHSNGVVASCTIYGDESDIARSGKIHVLGQANRSFPINREMLFSPDAIKPENILATVERAAGKEASDFVGSLLVTGESNTTVGINR